MALSPMKPRFSLPCHFFGFVSRRWSCIWKCTIVTLSCLFRLQRYIIGTLTPQILNTTININCAASLLIHILLSLPDLKGLSRPGPALSFRRPYAGFWDGPSLWANWVESHHITSQKSWIMSSPDALLRTVAVQSVECSDEKHNIPLTISIKYWYT